MSIKDCAAPAFPYPSEQNGFLVEHVSLLRQSLRELTGRDLVDKGLSCEQAAREIFEASFIVLSHSSAPDPILTYGNLATLNLFEMTWDELVAMPSRYTAEELEREERACLLEKVAADGFMDDYSGIRISTSGRRFRIENATVWNLRDVNGSYYGQAATFETWTFLG